MTYPGPEGQWQSQQGQPYQPQQGYQPQQPQYGYDPAQSGYYQQPSGAYPVQQPEPPRRSRKGLVIGLVVALVVLLGGGGTWFALSQSGGGADTPREAAMNLATSIGNGDVVGMLSTLAPAEAALFTDPVEEAVAELKRLQILQPNADPKALSGVQIKTENLTFDDAAAQQVNDHLTITKLTGGTITINADLTKVPFAKDFLDATMRGRQEQNQTETIDIAEHVRETGEPIRIATVQVDGSWYPSMLYTIADYGLLEEKKPWPAQGIPANGAASSNDAVKELAQAVLDADIRRVIELLPPDEMAVLHDVGPAILEEAGRAEPIGGKILDLTTTSSSVSGGTRATLASLEVESPDGDRFSIRKDGDCYSATAQGRTERICADQLPALFEQNAGRRGILPPEVVQVVQSLATGVFKQGIGVITTEVEGKHYVSPIRSLTEQGMTVLRSLKPEDIKALMNLAR
ncbi:flagellar basal body protein FliL [Amycolatopsis suaedae]|uniref:Flagellar basal body protein FliL n=1 Tax=Amycolatopsis suaedae TaxID=2510978 RepID=A0A4Q7J7R4_9PSEU|nr:flagellar basal body protein FliL [Amycolatopsis suaedae]RZQ63720.1 flagellar basal body protein FliL [Amycolatopsis suaedae]